MKIKRYLEFITEEFISKDIKNYHRSQIDLNLNYNMNLQESIREEVNSVNMKNDIYSTY